MAHPAFSAHQQRMGSAAKKMYDTVEALYAKLPEHVRNSRSSSPEWQAFQKQRDAIADEFQAACRASQRKLSRELGL